MIASITVTLPEYHRRVSVLALLVVALAAPAQEAETPASGEGPLRVPDIVITGADAIIIVPPLPVLPGGGIPVPRVELQPIPFLPAPADCPPPDPDVRPEPVEPVCITLALSDRLPFFLLRGDWERPRTAIADLGIHYTESDRDSGRAPNNGGNE
jgi:hypothetical protein